MTAVAQEDDDTFVRIALLSDFGSGKPKVKGGRKTVLFFSKKRKTKTKTKTKTNKQTKGEIVVGGAIPK